MKRVDNIVERAGHAVIGVGADPDSNVSGFGYTVGRTSKHFPELAVTGLEVELTTKVLNWAANLKDPPLCEPILFDPAAPQFKFMLLPIPASVALSTFTIARAKYGDDFEMLQVVWPDTKGAWPWDGAYDSEAFPQQIYSSDTKKEMN